MDTVASITDEKYIKKVSSTHPANYFSIFFIIVGPLLLALGISMIIERSGSLSRNTSSSIQNSPLPFVVVGAVFLCLGIFLFTLKRKTDCSRLGGTVTRSLYIWDTSMKEWPTTATLVWINPVGIGRGGEDAPFIVWNEVTRTQWRGLYARDAYQLNTPRKAYLFSFANPASAKAEEIAYIGSSAMGDAPHTAAAAYISVSNMRDISNLLAIHVYSRCYVQHGVSFWSNRFEEIFFKFMFAIVTTIVVVMIQYSTLSVIYPESDNFGLVMAIAPLLLCLYFAYVVLKDLVFLRSSIKKPHVA